MEEMISCVVYLDIGLRTNHWVIGLVTSRFEKSRGTWRTESALVSVLLAN